MRRFGQVWLVLITTAAFYGIAAALVAGNLELGSSVTLALCLSWLVWWLLAGAVLGPDVSPAPSWRSSARRPRLLALGVLALVWLPALLLGGQSVFYLAVLAMAPIGYVIISFSEVRERQRTPS